MTEDNADGVAGSLVPHNPASQSVEQMKGGTHALQSDEYWQGTVLDIRDPVEAGISDLVHVYRHRRHSLMMDGDPFATFANSARNLDLPNFGTAEAILHLIQKEQTNINTMRRNGTLFDPNNADALGAYLELAFNANLLYGWIKRYMQGFR